MDHLDDTALEVQRVATLIREDIHTQSTGVLQRLHHSSGQKEAIL